MTLSASNSRLEQFYSKHASGTLSKWSLPISCLSETVMRQAGTLSWLKSIPIGLHWATFPRLASLITVPLQHRKQKSEVRRLIKALHVEDSTDNPSTPPCHPLLYSDRIQAICCCHDVLLSNRPFLLVILLDHLWETDGNEIDVMFKCVFYHHFIVFWVKVIVSMIVCMCDKCKCKALCKPEEKTE